MPLILIQGSNTLPESTNWPLDLHQALGQDNDQHLKDIVTGYQNAQPENFVEQLVNRLDTPEQFLRMTTHTAWDDNIYLQVARQLRDFHTHHPNFVKWVNTSIMQNSSLSLQPWQLHWAGLCENLSVLQDLLNDKVEADGLFFYILASERKELFDFLVPFARTTLKEPTYVLAFAHRISEEHDDFVWIDGLLDQYTCAEVCEEIALSNPDLLDDLRNYVVQHYLKELPIGSSIKPKKI